MIARDLLRLGCLATTLALMLPAAADACPFCNAVTPTFAEQRESATVCALAEAIDQHEELWRFRVHRVHQGEGAFQRDAVIECKPDAAMQAGDLALLLGWSEGQDGATPEWRWEATKVDILTYRYFAAAPDMRNPTAERLAYYVPFLESREADISADAFAELGRAPLEAVEAVANGEVVQRVRTWTLSDELPDERRGGYGLMLGLAKDPEERTANATALCAAIEKNRGDFRAGFDGLLAGYLLLEPDEALRLIDERFIANAEARPGDTRHALNALRFCVEYARGPKKENILEVTRHGLSRPAFAADIVTDLARWQDWTPVDEIAALFEPPDKAKDASLQRAVIGYLNACATTAARDHLERLRANDPEGVRAIERKLELPLNR